MIYDVVIAGGGLAGSLAAWRLATICPHYRLCVLERGATLGGNHTWSFHDTDLPDSVGKWLAPLIAAHWSGHQVRFPSRTRLLSGGYAAITSERLHAIVAPTLGERLRLNSTIEQLTRRSVVLTTGETLSARLVIDARGGCPTDIPLGWQTFVGQELELEHDHDVAYPILMDATVPQAGGFRFIYVLPWNRRRLLVEDTLYAEERDIDHAARVRLITDYATQHGWRVRAVVREERGALPIPLAGSGAACWTDEVVRIGVGAGLFHPTTGYSLPDAAATADLLTTLDLGDADRVYHTMKNRALRLWDRRAFFRLLNRFLFRAADPEARVHVLQQFYRRPEALIARFYGDRLSWLDRCRLLAGRPPVPLRRAVAQLRATAW